MQTWRDYLQFASHRFIVWCTLLPKLGRQVTGGAASTLRVLRGAGERSRPRYRIRRLFTMQSLTNLCHGSAPPLCIKTQKLKNGRTAAQLGQQVNLAVVKTPLTFVFRCDRREAR